MIKFSQFRTKTLIAAVALALTACGGGSSASGSSSSAGGSTVSGVAASGAPIIGKVTIKDSKNAQKTVDILADGTYTVDVTGMTAPFVLRAVGKVGGNEVSLVSTATTADIGKTVNITPFTDLIVSNIAGTAAAQFFDNPVFANLTPAEINDARDKLTARLQPILTSMGVAASFDLLRTAFKADHTAFDAVMDVVKVSVDSIAKKAVITDLINNQQIIDDLASTLDTTVIAAPPAGSLTGAVTDLVAIQKGIDGFNTLFATSIPAANNPNLLNLFDATLLENGADLATFLSPSGLLSVDNVGLKLQSVVIKERIDANTIEVTLAGTDKKGTFKEDFIFKKGIDGVWRNAGNQRIADVNVHAINNRWIAGGNISDQFTSFIEFWVNHNARNDIQGVKITGPGLNDGTGKNHIVLIRSTIGSTNFNVFGLPYETSWVQSCAEVSAGLPCVDLTQVPDNGTAAYTVTYYSAPNTPIANIQSDTYILQRKPVSNTDAQANALAWFATPDTTKFLPLSYKQFTANSGITVAWTNATATGYQPSSLGLFDQTSGISMRQDLIGNETSKLLGTWPVGVPAPTTAPNLWGFTSGPFDRQFVTGGFYPG